MNIIDRATDNKYAKRPAMNKFMLAGLVVLGMIYAATLILIVDSAIKYKQEETIELTSSKAEAVASLVAANLNINDTEYAYLLGLSFSELLSDQLNRKFERDIRSAVDDNSITYVYLISKLPDSQTPYRVNPDEAEDYGFEAGTPLDYVYLLDAVSSDQQRIDDTDGLGYSDKDRYTSMPENFVSLYNRRKSSHIVLNDRWGSFITGFAPCYSREGSYLGMIGVDISMAPYQASMMRFHAVIGSFVLINLIIVSLAVWLIRYAVRSHSINNQQRLLLDHDALTLTLSRRGMMRALTELCSMAAASELSKPAHFFIIDVDHFKEYNDYYGHLKGDQALQRIGQLLRQSAEDFGGVAGRYGGDEFMMILSDIGDDCIREVADEIIEHVRSLEIEHARSPVSVYKSVSIGMATIRSGDEMTPEELIETADRALYRAKRNGRNQASA